MVAGAILNSTMPSAPVCNSVFGVLYLKVDIEEGTDGKSTRKALIITTASTAQPKPYSLWPELLNHSVFCERVPFKCENKAFRLGIGINWGTTVTAQLSGESIN